MSNLHIGKKASFRSPRESEKQVSSLLNPYEKTVVFFQADAKYNPNQLFLPSIYLTESEVVLLIEL